MINDQCNIIIIYNTKIIITNKECEQSVCTTTIQQQYNIMNEVRNRLCEYCTQQHERACILCKLVSRVYIRRCVKKYSCLMMWDENVWQHFLMKWSIMHSYVWYELILMSHLLCWRLGVRYTCYMLYTEWMKRIDSSLITRSQKSNNIKLHHKIITLNKTFITHRTQHIFQLEQRITYNNIFIYV